MKITRVVNTDGFKTWAKDEVEKVTNDNKTYIVSRFIEYQKTNVLPLRKQKIVKDMLNKGEDIVDISNVIGVPVKTISIWLSHYRMGGCKYE